MGSVLSKPDRLPVESLLLDVADVLATSLDLDTTLRRVAEVVRKVIDYEIFAILLLNEKTQELAFPLSGRLSAGICRTQPHQSWRGSHRAGRANAPGSSDRRCHSGSALHRGVPNVRSELAIPLITKNRVIGVIDIEAREPGYFTEEHKRCSRWSPRAWRPASKMRSSTRAPRSRRAFCCC